MSNFSKEKAYAIVVDAVKGPMIQQVDKKKVDSFIHDVVEGFFEAYPISDIGQYSNIMMLANEEARLIGMKLNPWATLIFSNKRGLIGPTYLFGDVVLLKRAGVELEPFTKEEAADMVLILKGAKGGFKNGISNELSGISSR